MELSPASNKDFTVHHESSDDDISEPALSATQLAQSLSVQHLLLFMLSQKSYICIPKLNTEHLTFKPSINREGFVTPVEPWSTGTLKSFPSAMVRG